MTVDLNAIDPDVANQGAQARAEGPDPNHPHRVTVARLRLLHDYVAVAALAVPMRQAGGRMFIPEAAGVRERSQRGIVLAIGAGDYTDDGMRLVPVTVQPGDLVFYGKYAGTEEELGGRTVLIMRETECRVSVPVGSFRLVEHDNPKLNHLVEDWCDVCYGDPDAEAKARLEAAREDRAAQSSAICMCGCRADVHAHLTGPCGNHDTCMEFSPLMAVSVDEVSKLTALVSGLPPELAAAAQALVLERRPCAGADGAACLFMQARYGPEWVGLRCGHRHPATLVEP